MLCRSSLRWCCASYRALICPDIPAQACMLPHALSRHGYLLSSANAMPGIRSNIQVHSLFVCRQSCRECQITRSAVPVYRCGVSLLYIKQLYTLPCVSRCQPPKSKSENSLLSLSVLALTLFVLRIFTDYSDASFSFNNLAFFTNWFY